MEKHIITIIIIFFAISTFGQRTEHLGWQINTEYDEREPILSPDGKTLYFWRRLSPGNTGGIDDHGDIWFSRKLRDGRWAPAQHMEYPLNSTGHDFVWQVSQAHDTLWMTQVPRGRRSSGIAFATRSRYGGWNMPRPVEVRGLQSRGNCKDYFLSPEKILLLPNQGPDTYGGSDLYVCFPINDTTWSAPINLGPVVNTARDEDAPFLSEDGKTLFFNSNGYLGEGDHDIYMTTRLDDSWRRWSEPVNLGQPINTSAYDYDFRIAPGGDYAYWGSESNTRGKGDIYRLNLRDCALDIFPAGDQVICQGDSVVLEAGFAFHSDLTFQWYKDDRPIPGARERSLVIKESGTYHLKRNMGECVANSIPQRISVKPLPNIPITAPADFLCEGDSILLWAGRAKDLTYQWEKDGLTIPDANRPGYWAKGPGSYRVALNNGECDFYSNVVTLDQIPKPEIFLPGDIVPTSTASLPKWLWANKTEFIKGDYWIKDLVTDAKGNIYVLSVKRQGGRLNEYLTKFFSEGPVNFSKSIYKSKGLTERFMTVDENGYTTVARGGDEKFLTKYSSNGVKVWQIDTNVDRVCGVATDAVGNIYTYGRFNQMINLGDGPIVPSARGSIFIAKHTPTGKLVWVNRFPVDGSQPDMGNALHVDKTGNVYIGGAFHSIANFGEKILRAPVGRDSYFLAKFGSKGVLHWAAQIDQAQRSKDVHDLYVHPAGGSYFLIGENIYRYDANGRFRSNIDINLSDEIDHIRMVAHQDQEYLVSYSSKSRTYDLGLVSMGGRVISLWEGGKGEKSAEHFPVIDVTTRGGIIMGGISLNDDLPVFPLGQGKRSPVFISKFGKPEVRALSRPINLCDKKDEYLLSTDVRGVKYQWLKNGSVIPNARASVLAIEEPGDYQVRIVGGSCENISNIQKVVKDCDDQEVVEETTPTIATNPPVSTKSEDNPVEIEAPEPIQDPYRNDVPELERTIAGKPDKLDNREVFRQGDVRIRNNTVTIYIWDHEVLDQDTVSLNINGEWVLKDYGLESEKKVITYTFDRSNTNNFIILYANNLGLKPPNTASIMLDDGYRKRTVRLRSTLEDCGMLNIQLE